MGFSTDVQKLFKRNRFVGFGIPFLVLLVGGSFALKQFTQLRYTFRHKQLLKTNLFGRDVVLSGHECLSPISIEVLSPEEAEAAGAKLKPPDEAPTLEKEYEKLKEMNLDDWENVRGRRPWETTSDQTDKRKT